MLALRCRGGAELVLPVRFDVDLRPTGPDGPGQRDYVHHVRTTLQDAVRGDDDSRAAQPSFAPDGCAQVDLDDVTRAQY